MENKRSRSVKSFIGSSEKACNKCGFVTYCLRVLYKHKYKCQGQLYFKVKPSKVCGHCKRRFEFYILYRQHKKTCVKHNLKKQNILLKRKSTKKKTDKQHVKKLLPSISCQKCQRLFKNIDEYDVHLKRSDCKSNKFKSSSHSARKTLPKRQNFHEKSISNAHSLFPKYRKETHFPSIVEECTNFMCVQCNKLYPTKKELISHLERKKVCALAHYQQISYVKEPKMPLTARKTFKHGVARKTFSRKPRDNFISMSKFKSIKNVEGSARKSLSYSMRKHSSYTRNSLYAIAPSGVKYINKCPVCYEEFSDSFNFFQHQKKFNHWGKATKSSMMSSKCPFCDKEFYHVRARNAHVRNHADKSKEDIESFLKSSTCSVCSQIFISESAKQQHVKLEHSNETNSLNMSSQNIINQTMDKNSSKIRYDCLPFNIKQKLKHQPLSCPICFKDFSDTQIRNKHFHENHMDTIYDCKLCIMKFNSSDALARHIHQSHQKSYENFKAAKSLKSLSNKNIYDTNYKFQENCEYFCDICEISFQKLCGLQRHRQSKLHRDTLEKNLDAVHKSLADLPPSPPPRPRKSAKQPEILTCAECSEEFTTIKDFVPHRMSHFSVQSKYLEISEINPYKCEICTDVLDSHSNVQHHLFWHLQLESMIDEKSSKATVKNDSIKPDRLSGQRVARKSFTKQENETVQEVIIGGVKKPLFTCDGCKISFTTKSHYNIHINKFCKVKRSAQGNLKSPSKDKTGLSKNEENVFENPETETIMHCKKCNCLFASLAMYDLHKDFCSKNLYDECENDCKVDAVKSSMKLECAVAGCVTCGLPFDNFQDISEHIVKHQTDVLKGTGTNQISEIKVLESSDASTIVHCRVCNCLLSSQDILKYHEENCNESNYVSLLSEFHEEHIATNTSAIKSAIELKYALSGCIPCGLTFSCLKTFSDHMQLHQTKQNPDSNIANMLNKEETTDHIANSLNHIIMNNGEQPKLSNSEIIDNRGTLDEIFTEAVDVSDKSSQLNCSLPDDSLKNVVSIVENTTSDYSIPSAYNKTLNKLRSNFSQLLCILISDQELMQQLGFGEELVDNVLMSVLYKMDQKPVVEDNKISELERLRKNIEILLQFCLKDQVMALIANGKTVIDDIVIEALKMFGSEENIVSS